MIPVSKPYLPCFKKYARMLEDSFDRGVITNNGPYLRELEQRLADFLGVPNVICVTNGTVAIQLAIRSLGIKERVLTTPFSFIASSSALVYEGLTPKFVDICAKSFNLNPHLLEVNDYETVSAILPVHVYGNPCDVYAIDEFKSRHGLKVIYDASHAFDVKLNGTSILNWGDVSTLSFHATKAFHTIEGGAIVTCNSELADLLRGLRNFGINDDAEIKGLGINAKLSEFNAAMGLCILDDWDAIRHSRKQIWEMYTKELGEVFQAPVWSSEATRNYSYMPFLFNSVDELVRVKNKLEENNIFPRRYFYPSLNEIPYLSSFDFSQSCAVSTDIASRVMCFPIYPSLNIADVKKIITLTKASLKR